MAVDRDIGAHPPAVQKTALTALASGMNVALAMTKVSDHTARYRFKAQQLREIASQVADHATRQFLLHCADDFDRMADEVFVVELPQSSSDWKLD